MTESGDYISREAALLSLTPIIKRASERNRNILSAVKQCADAINWCHAADVRPVVLCGVCELHGHCYTEDVFAFARLADGNRFCAVGKAKTNGEGRMEES